MESIVHLTCLSLVLSLSHVTFAAFGDDISQDNEDNRFSVMGQVTKNTFDVVDGNIELVLDVEDTKDIAELWIIDFEPYRFNEDALPINELNGELLMENTGECSSVYESVEWTFFDDDYFKDRNAAELASKKLFTSFEFGGTYDANNIRTDQINYTGPLSTFFDCKKSDGFTDVWEKTSIASDDEIEYKTRLYATNVRPKDPADNTAGISFVQSHIVLIWRLSRQAIGNFIISSTAILRPLIDFARVSAIYDQEGDPIPEQARLIFRFTTILDSAEQKLAYSSTGFTFTPDNSLHGLNRTITEPATTLAAAPDCVIKKDYGTGQHDQCHQTWDFTLILNIDTTDQLKNSIPVDASATLDFFFDVYECPEGGTCTQVVTDAQVTTLITIQTVVFIRDEEEDKFTIIPISLLGANDHTLDSSQPASRPVAHKETVTLKVKFSPAVLRDEFLLALQLFMVCKGDIQDDRGCLGSPVNDRYIAATTDDFSYSVDVNGTEYTYSSANLTDDYTQALSSYGYEQPPDADPFHTSTFQNLALSAEESKYTITAVYSLEEITGRRKRHLSDEQLSRARKMIRSGYLTSTTFGTSVTAGRRKRAIEDSAAELHGLRMGMTAHGCPEGATHVADIFDCECPANTTYDLLAFECIDAHNEYVEPQPDEGDVIIVDLDEGSRAHHTTPSVVILIIYAIVQYLL